MIVIIMSSVSSTIYAQKITESEVPQIVKEKFAKLFPDQSVKWEKEKGNYEASFKKDEKKMSATFESGGKFLESETDINESKFPPLALNYLRNNYKGKKIQEFAKITDAGGVITFETEISGRDILFDNNGKFLREVKN